MQTLLLINSSEVLIQTEEGLQYLDSRKNFEKDYGKSFEYTLVDYNKSIGFCGIEGKYTNTPNEVLDELFNNISTYIERKNQRELDSIPPLTEEELQAQELEKAKQERAEEVSKIKVTVDGMQFDGDETAQTRMGRTISAAMALGVDLNTEKRTWVLADNTIAEPTIAQLAQALKLAGDEQTRLWTVPYEDETS